MKLMHKKSLAIAMTIAMFFVCLLTGIGVLKASAAGEEYFNYGGLENRTYIGGITKEEIISAFEAEAARLDAEMTAAGYENNFRLRDGAGNPLGNGWPGNGGTYLVYAMLSMGDFDRGAGAWEADTCFMIFNPHTEEAYTMRGEALHAWLDVDNGWSAQTVKIGYPVGNQFTVEGIDYQNFGLGYTKGSNGRVEIFYGMKVDAQGVESEMTAEDIAKGMIIPVYQDTANTAAAAEIAAQSVEGYEEAYAAYYAEKDLNFNAIQQNNAWLHSTWRQPTADGGNVVYNARRGAMFTVKTFLTQFNSSADWGAPIGEESVIQGVTNQLFANGVAVVEEDEVNFYAACHVDPDTGEIVSDLDSGAVGKLSPEAEEQLPSGVTVEAIASAAQAVYEEEMGAATDFMMFFEGTDILVQTFIAKDEETDTNLTTQIFIDVTKATLEAVVLDSTAYDLYSIPTRFNEGNKLYDVTGEMILGPAISNAFTVEETTYQNFLYGAMNLTSTDAETQVLPGVNYAADGTRTVLDLSSFITINASAIRIPDSYEVGAADLLEKFKTAYSEYVEQGIALGMPNIEGIGAWAAVANGQETGTNEFIDGQGMIKLGLHMTDSNAICYYGVTAMLAYSPKDGNVYILSDSVVSNMATYYCYFGAPTSNLTETTLLVDGVEVAVEIQNFELGYLTVMGVSASMINDKNWDFELRGPVNLDGSKIPGTTYPGENEGGNPSGDAGNQGNQGNQGDNNQGGEEEKGCGSVISVGGGVGAVLVLVAATAVIFSKKRKEV